MNTLLEIKNITKYFGSGDTVSKALNGVSFSMERGEFTAVMGASGSGKSTLLNVIATIDHPSSGHILLEGRDIAGMQEQELAAFRRDRLGFIFQEYNLLDTLAGMLLRSSRLKNKGTNTVILRGLSGKMTVNSLLIGALATLLVFAIAMSNVAFGEKTYDSGRIPPVQPCQLRNADHRHAVCIDCVCVHGAGDPVHQNPVHPG